MYCPPVFSLSKARLYLYQMFYDSYVLRVLQSLTTLYVSYLFFLHLPIGYQLGIRTYTHNVFVKQAYRITLNDT